MRLPEPEHRPAAIDVPGDARQIRRRQRPLFFGRLELEHIPRRRAQGRHLLRPFAARTRAAPGIATVARRPAQAKREPRVAHQGRDVERAVTGAKGRFECTDKGRFGTRAPAQPWHTLDPDPPVLAPHALARLLRLEVLHQARPAGKAVLACQHELRVVQAQWSDDSRRGANSGPF